MDTKARTALMHDTSKKKLEAVFKVLLAFALVITLTPTTNALAEGSTSQAQLLGLELETSNADQGVIEGIVFTDANANNLRDEGEAIVTDCIVTYGMPGDKASAYAQAKTDAQGKFTFTNVPDGSYTVRVASQTINSENYVSTQENSTDPVEESITLEAPVVASVSEPEVESGVTPDPENLEMSEAELAEQAITGDGSLSGMIWFDENEDGIKDDAEPGISGYPVDLYQDGVVTQSTVTDGMGVYSFIDLVEGDYQVGISAQTLNNIEYLIPMKMMQAGTDNLFDVDLSLDPVASLTELISLEASAQVSDINAGMRVGQQVEPAAVTGGYIVTGDTTTTNYGTYNTLRAAATACVTTEPCTITVTADDTLGINEYLVINHKEVTLTSGVGGPYTITDGGEGIVESWDFSKLTLTDIVLSGSSASTSHSLAMAYDEGELIVASGAVLQDCHLPNGHGGALSLNGVRPKITITGGEIKNNSAQQGGAISTGYSDGTITISGGKISGNKATGGSLGLGYGGAIMGLNSFPSIIITGGEISGNEAAEAGGGVYSVDANFTMTGGKISGNTAVNGAGIYGVFDVQAGEISGNIASQNGGGIYYANSGGTIDLGTCIVDDNEAAYGGGIYVAEDATLSSGAISGNTATQNGGGVYVATNTPFTMDGGTISGNTAADSGGGVYFDHNYGGGATINDGLVTLNKANKGAGMYFYMHDVPVVNGGEISYNEAASYGGGVYADQSTVALDGGTINNNKAVYGGGECSFPLAGYDSGGVSIQGAEVVANEAIYGGGLYSNDANYSTSMHLTSGNLKQNVADYGGGVYTSGAGASLTADSAFVFEDNEANFDGGAIFTDRYSYADPVVSGSYSNLRITSATFTNNQAATTSTPPSNASIFIYQFDGTLLNNNDINYKIAHALTYDANNTSGGTYVDPVQYAASESITAKALSATPLVADIGYEFDYWCTNPGGTSAGGTRYDVGQVFNISAPTTLYAIWKLDPAQTYPVDLEYYFNGTHDVGYDTTINPQVLSTVTVTDVALSTTPTGYMLDSTPTVPTLPETAANLNGTTVAVYYVTDPSQTASISIEYYFDGTHNSSYDATIAPQILATVNQADVVLGTTPTGYMLDSTPTNPAMPATAQSLNGTTVSVYYVTDPAQTASINIEYYFNGTHDTGYDATITPQILATVNQSDVVLGTTPTGYMLDTPSTSPALPASAQSLNSTTVSVYYVTDPSQTATIDIEYYFDGTHNSSYDTTITPQILGTVTQSDVVLGTTPTGYMLDPTPTAPALPASALILNGTTVSVYYVTDPSQTASIDIEYYFDGTHNSSYDATITPQILASVTQSDVVLGTTPTGYMLDTPATAPGLPASAQSLNGTTISVYYVTDASQRASIDIEYYFDGTHNSSYDANITPQILGTVNQADVVLGTTPTGYMLDSTPTAPTLPASAQSLNNTTVSVYYVTDPSQTASISIEYYFDGMHNSSYDATITPQVLASVGISSVALNPAPSGYILDSTPTSPVLPQTASTLNGTTVEVYYITDTGQTASIDIEYYFDGTHNTGYDRTINPQVLSSVNVSDVALASAPVGYMLDTPATSPTLPQSALVLDGTTISVYYITDPSQTASIDIEYYFNGTHNSSYDANITPQILSSVGVSDVVLATTPTGYMLDTPSTSPALPASAQSLNSTTVASTM